MNPVIIIGAGLSGLTAAFHLSKFKIPFQILEARNRPGGRIHTLQGPLEMGATWFSGQHLVLRRLLEELKVEYFEQSTEGKIAYDVGINSPIQFIDMPSGQAPSFRISGGSQAIIDKLLQESGKPNICYDTQVLKIRETKHSIVLTDQQDNLFEADRVILTLPSQLLAHNIEMNPKPQEKRIQVMQQTHTWMGESIKFGVTYPRPFWKMSGLSGMGFTQTGIIQEVHDHTDIEKSFFALKGFLNPDLDAISLEERRTLVIDQLVKLFGDNAADFNSYHDTIWSKEEFTSVKGVPLLAPHQNNGHPELSEPLMNGKLIIAGSESSAIYPGYMDGAVYSGIRAARLVQEDYAN